MSENEIEINGKRYDAVTGHLLGQGHSSVAQILAPASKRKAVDGIMRHPKTSATPKAYHQKTAALKMSVPKPPVATKINSAPSTPKRQVTITAKDSAHHHPQKAQTLMRRAVHKPDVTMKQKVKVHAPAEIVAKTPSAIAIKHSVTQINPKRQARASAVTTHSAVRRFPAHRPEFAPVDAAIRHNPAVVPVIAVKQAPPMEHPRAAQHNDIFEAAIARATSHEQPVHPHRRHRSHRRRMVNTLAGFGAFLVIGSFFAWLNMPNIQLHVASIQAGFKAEIPEYRPTGYAMQGGVQRYGNTVSMSFRSGSSQFHLVQQPSDWNSQTLKENTLALSDGHHKTVDVNGRTVYIYGEGNAAWVDGGVRYDLTGNASLGADEITHLVSSL